MITTEKALLERTEPNGRKLYYQQTINDNGENCFCWVSDPKQAHVFADEEEAESTRIMVTMRTRSVIAVSAETILGGSKEVERTILREAERIRKQKAEKKKVRKEQDTRVLFADEKKTLPKNRRERRR